MIDDDDFRRMVINEKAREGMLQIAYMVSDYYRTLISQSVPWEVASTLTLHFQDKLLNPARGSDAAKGAEHGS